MGFGFYFGSILAVHVPQDSGLKIPPDPDKYEPTEYPHWGVFSTLHLGGCWSFETLAHNAQVIGKLTEKQVKTITLMELKRKGFDDRQASYME